jgi:hypothetical protein
MCFRELVNANDKGIKTESPLGTAGFYSSEFEIIPSVGWLYNARRFGCCVAFSCVILWVVPFVSKERTVLSQKLSIQLFWDCLKVEGEGSTLTSKRRRSTHLITLRHISEV